MYGDCVELDAILKIAPTGAGEVFSLRADGCVGTCRAQSRGDCLLLVLHHLWVCLSLSVTTVIHRAFL